VAIDFFQAEVKIFKSSEWVKNTEKIQIFSKEIRETNYFCPGTGGVVGSKRQLWDPFNNCNLIIRLFGWRISTII
jgi:hypothetical protein